MLKAVLLSGIVAATQTQYLMVKKTCYDNTSSYTLTGGITTGPNVQQCSTEVVLLDSEKELLDRLNSCGSLSSDGWSSDGACEYSGEIYEIKSAKRLNLVKKETTHVEPEQVKERRWSTYKWELDE